MTQSLVLSGVIVVGATVGIYFGSGWLEHAGERLSTYYGLPLVVQGAIVAAVGSSFPELASVVMAAVFENSLHLGVGAIVGSAIFNILVIPALSGIVTEDHIESSRTLVYKEAQFYMIAVSVLLITFAMAVIYYPISGGGLSGSITRPLALIPLALYGLYVFIQSQDTAEHEAPEDGSHVAPAREWGRLAVGLLVILIAIHFLVQAVATIGSAFGVPEFVMGVTVIAAATSLPDSLVSVRAATDGRGVTSLANVLGSNTFDLLVAIPLGVLIVGRQGAAIDFEMAVPMFGVLTAATILLFTVLRTDLKLSDVEAYGLLGSYALFVVWIIAETTGWVGGILPK